MKFIERYFSIQGEGRYVGVPSLFLRTTGCNLRCEWKNPDGSISRCDTPYTSWEVEAAKYIMTAEDVIAYMKTYPNIKHIVITGGEPTMYPEIEEFVKTLVESQFVVTIETNGTIYRKLPGAYISMSPKLSSSTPAGKLGEMHSAARYNKEAFQRYLKSNTGQLKFVYSRRGDEIEIMEWLASVNFDKLVQDDRWKVYLMPQGITDEVLTENLKRCVDICLAKGWYLTDRLHIRIWGHIRGV